MNQLKKLHDAIQPMENYLEEFLKGIAPNMGHFLQSLKPYFEEDGKIISDFKATESPEEAKAYLESLLRMQGMLTIINKFVGEKQHEN